MTNKPELIVEPDTAQALETFAPIRQELYLLVDSVKDLDLPDPSDKKQANVVIEARKRVKKARTLIENRRKELVRPFLDKQKSINEVASELKTLIADEESRLSELENDRKEWVRLEAERMEREHQELVDMRTQTMQHLGVNMPPSVLGAMDDRAWELLLEESTEAYEKKQATKKKADAKAQAKAEADREKMTKEEWQHEQMIEARVAISTRLGCPLSRDDAESLSKEEWALYQSTAEAKIKEANRQEITKDREVAQAVAGGPVKVSDRARDQALTFVVSDTLKGLAVHAECAEAYDEGPLFRALHAAMDCLDPFREVSQW